MPSPFAHFLFLYSSPKIKKGRASEFIIPALHIARGAGSLTFYELNEVFSLSPSGSVRFPLNPRIWRVF